MLALVREGLFVERLEDDVYLLLEQNSEGFLKMDLNCGSKTIGLVSFGERAR